MELLERIRFITNSDYISDLACNRYLTFYQFHEIEEINIDDYSLKEWNDAAKYVSNQNKEFNNSLAGFWDCITSVSKFSFVMVTTDILITSR